ncbi:MAG: class I SAM-dependent methyltransferase [bacterium]|nr:class I SAM-dependent methyltransferase [bacterium]
MRSLLPLLDILGIVPLAISAGFMKLIRRIGIDRLPLCRSTLEWVGIFPIRDHYYEPLFSRQRLRHSLDQERELPGINLNEQGQLQLLNSLDFADELVSINDTKTSHGLRFSYDNGSFLSGDAELLYSVIRHFKPRTIIEVGSGNSSIMASLAVSKNVTDSGVSCEHICIEPYQAAYLEELPVKVIRQPLEDCNLSLFSKLDKGDLLFIDSSHMIRPQGDVLYEYLNILPRLRSGVIVHIHDIFTPRDYLTTWITKDMRFWNEQYLLEAVLSTSVKWKVMLAANWLHHHHYEELKRACPFLEPDREPGSFYIVATAD